MLINTDMWFDDGPQSALSPDALDLDMRRPCVLWAKQTQFVWASTEGAVSKASCAVFVVEISWKPPVLKSALTRMRGIVWSFYRIFFLIAEKKNQTFKLSYCLFWEAAETFPVVCVFPCRHQHVKTFVPRIENRCLFLAWLSKCSNLDNTDW